MLEYKNETNDMFCYAMGFGVRMRYRRRAVDGIGLGRMDIIISMAMDRSHLCFFFCV